MSTLTVTIVQADLHWHDAEANRKAFGQVIQSLDAPADLIVLPEMFSTGFTMDAPDQAETMKGATVSWLRETAREADAAVCGSIIVKDRGHYYNRFILMQTNGAFTVYDKRHLFRLAGEHKHFAAGDVIETIALSGWKIRPMVCYDLRFPIWSRRSGTDEFELLIYVANWPSPRHHAWRTLLRARAIENQCFVVGVNRSGTDDNGMTYSGGSAIVDYLGHDLVELGDSVAVATETLDLDPLREFRSKFPFDVDADDYLIK